MTINKNYLSAMMAGIAFSMSMGAQASMGNLGTTYGVLPTDVATAQGLSMFNTQMSSLYYNPSYMVKDPHGGLTAGLMHAAPSLQLESQGGAAPLSRDGGNVLNNTPSQHVLLGMKTNLSSLTTMQHPVYFGVVVGVEKYGMEMLAFESGTSSEGQFLEYDRQPLFLLLGGATNLWRGIDVGASARVTLHAESKLSATSTLAGVTSNEKLGVSAKPDIRPTAGLTIDWGKTVCP
ncbi:MAG: aromatic hydrocarbon degradation protein, partial [Venatoribacter sp.]